MRDNVSVPMQMSIVKGSLAFLWKWILQVWWETREGNILEVKANAISICKWNQL